MIWIIIITVLFFLFNFFFSAPSTYVSWALKKFELYSKLDPKDVTVTFNGKQLGIEDKKIFVEYFNEAYILKRHVILKGKEELFLHPETDVTPFVMNIKNDKKDINFFVYRHEDEIEVVKQDKKKVESYSLSSQDLQNFTMSTNGLV